MTIKVCTDDVEEKNMIESRDHETVHRWITVLLKVEPVIESLGNLKTGSKVSGTKTEIDDEENADMLRTIKRYENL